MNTRAFTTNESTVKRILESADFGKSGAESGTRPCEQACNERQNPDKDLKRMQGCELPIIQEADFGKSGAVQDYCHSGSLEKYYEFTNSYFRKQNFCHSELDSESKKFCVMPCAFSKTLTYSKSINANENPIKLDRFRSKSGMTSPRKMQLMGTEIKSSSHLSGMTILRDLYQFVMTAKNNVCKNKEITTMVKDKNVTHLFTHSLIYLFTPQNTGLLRHFAPRNDVKDLVPFHPLSLPSPSRGEGSKNVMNLSSYRLIDFPTLKKKAAFTLAEVLITLGIIGIVAAMTIPNLIAEQQKRTTVTKLQRAMSVLNQAYRRAYDDVGEATAEEAASMGSEEYFNKYWAPYLKTVHICKTYEDCGYDSVQPFTLFNGQNPKAYLISSGTRVTVKTMDGFTYIIFTRGGMNTGVFNMIWVDINGSAKPNIFGKDIFMFERFVDGEKGGVVLPYGDDKTLEQINARCNKTGGDCYTCAEKIRRAGWKIEKDYPW